MSAELWAEFGKASEDLAANPWAQRSPVEAQAPSSSISRAYPQSYEQSDLPLSRQTDTSVTAEPASSGPQTPWGPSESTSPLHRPQAPVDLKTSDAWTGFKDTNDDSWSDFASPGELTDPWSQPKSTFQSIPSWNTGPAEQSTTDDFGDFEDPTQEVSKEFKRANLSPEVSSTSGQLAESQNCVVKSSPKASHQRSKSLQQKDPYAGLESLNQPASSRKQIKTVRAIHPPKLEPKSETEPAGKAVSDAEDEWDEWSPDPIRKPNVNQNTPPNPVQNTKTKAAQHVRSNSEPAERVKARAQSRTRMQQAQNASTMPPSNVPPPSILISLVCGLVEKLPVQVETAIEGFSKTVGSDQALENALRQCLAALRVAARIVAGRKVRWKRDTHLAQSMSIGPAGKSGGMKLSGVDRSEIKREDREVVEFVQIWQKKLGSIRKALAMVNSRIAGKPLALPDIAPIMLIKTVKQVDGGVAAPKCCFLCGVKRDERVDKVDIDVFDSFGEWWAEHWGHSECRDFWNEHERYLQQR